MTVVSIGWVHDDEEAEYAGILQRADIAIDLRRHFRDPHVRADLRQLTAHDQVVRDTVMNTLGARQVLAATALQVQGYLAGPTAAPLTRRLQAFRQGQASAGGRCWTRAGRR
ncbi:hypothetical protein [Streptomyces sp. AK02-04a]|uniref:RapZ C-terminal domain-containing protein n=1 Tax=Streptomyces sp. AK02-04a TaxID=3028649 RepID=UPI0039F52D6E